MNKPPTKWASADRSNPREEGSGRTREVGQGGAKKTTNPATTFAQRLFASRLWNGWSPGILTIAGTTLIAAFAGALMGLLWEARSGETEWLYWPGIVLLSYLPIAGKGLRRLLWAECAAVVGALYFFGGVGLWGTFELSNPVVGPVLYVCLYLSLAVPLFSGRDWRGIGMGHVGLLAGVLGVGAGVGIAQALDWRGDVGRWSLMSAVGWSAFGIFDYAGVRWFPPRGIQSGATAVPDSLPPAAALPPGKGALISFGAVRALAGAAFLSAAVIPVWLILHRTKAAEVRIPSGMDARPAMEVIRRSPWKARSVREILDSDISAVLNEGSFSADTAMDFHAQAYCNRLSEMENRQPCYAADGTARSPCDGYQVENGADWTFWIVLSPPEDAPPPPPPPSPPHPACPAEMVYLQAGTFRMGSEPDDDDAYANERPAHDVTLSAFCLDVAEVTVAKYLACTKQSRNGVQCRRLPAYELCNGDRSDRSDHPINCVTWDEADTYCKWAGGQLPTEAQWEYAARGTQGRKYPWGDEPAPGPDMLNACGTECEDSSNPGWRPMYEANDDAVFTAPVKSYPKGNTPEGVSDLAGNVWEWVADWNGDYQAAPSTNPLQKKGKRRQPRGGSWSDNISRWVRGAYRGGDGGSLRGGSVGFRCAAVPSP